tara:strand:+ start:1039 stop:1965 length:927 start_codon:yes stop_codon:yes gene_type:complete
MLTSFFGSSKPVNVIIVISFMTIAFFMAHLGNFSTDLSWQHFAQTIGLWLVYLTTMFVLNFIAQKNDLTKRNAYRIVIFAAFTAALPSALMQPRILISGLIILLALRRIISLRSGLAIERKLFDASFWIAVASLFYFWAIAFYIVLFFGVMVFVSHNVRYWLIPFLGAICVAILTYCYVLYMGSDTSFFLDYLDGISFDFSAYNSSKVLVVTAFLIAIFIWSVFNYILEMKNASLKLRPIYALVLALSAVSLLIVTVTSQKTGAAWYFFIPSLSVITTTYLEKAKGILFKELLLWLIVGLPFVIFFLN